MFGRKKEPKKHVYEHHFMHENGLPNFLNDTICNIKIDEPNNCIVFSESKKKNIEQATATLGLEKITSTELGEKGSTLSSGSTSGAIVGGILGGTTGAIIGSTAGKKAPNIPTLKIRYKSGNDKEEINIYQCNYYSEHTIQLLKQMIDRNIKNHMVTNSNIDL